MNKKLHIKNRLFNQTLAETLVDPETGEIIAEKGTIIDRRTAGSHSSILRKWNWLQNLSVQLVE